MADEIAELIEILPAADVEPVRHGGWIPYETPTGVEAFGYKEMWIDAFRCSECGKLIDVSESGFSYCPYCGAKMDKEDAQ